VLTPTLKSPIVYDFRFFAEENVYRSVATFYKFVLMCPQLCLDAFLFEIPQVPYASDMKVGKSLSVTIKFNTVNSVQSEKILLDIEMLILQL
jgi:hypothetical protein